MTSRPRASIAVAGLIVAAGVGWFMRSRRASEPAPIPYAFDMCVMHATNEATLGAKRPVWNEAVLAGVARSLTPEEQKSLEDALGIAATRWEARANPALEDLEGGDPNASLIAWFKKGPSFLGTAQASARFRSCAPDGFCIAPRARNAACPSDFGAAADPKEEDRARFIHWSWGHALRYAAPSPDAARAAAAELRAHIHTSRAIAIVLSADDEEVTKKPPFDQIRERWGKVGKLETAVRRDKSALPSFAIDLSPDEIIVLPRHDVMSSAQPDEVVAKEVLAIAPALTVGR